MAKRTESASDIAIQVGKMKKEASTLENAYSILADSVRADVDAINKEKRLILESVINTVVSDVKDANKLPFLRNTFSTVDRLITIDETTRAKRKESEAQRNVLIAKRAELQQKATATKNENEKIYNDKEAEAEKLKPTALFNATFASVAEAINKSTMYDMSLEDIIANPQAYKKGMSVKYALSKSFRDVVNAIDSYESRTGRSFVISIADADEYLIKQSRLNSELNNISSTYKRAYDEISRLDNQIADLGRPLHAESLLLPTNSSDLIARCVTTAAIEWMEHLNASSTVKDKITSFTASHLYSKLTTGLADGSTTLSKFKSMDDDFAVLSAKRLVLIKELENVENVASNVKSIKKTFSNQSDKLDKLSRGRGRAQLSWDKEKVKSDWARYQTALTGQLQARKEQHFHISHNFNRDTLYGSPVYSSYNSSTHTNDNTTNWLLIWMLYSNSINNTAYAQTMDIEQLNNLSTQDVLSSLPEIQSFAGGDILSSISEGTSSTNFDIENLTSSFNDVISDAYSTSSGSSISLDSYTPSDSGSSSSWSSSSSSSSYDSSSSSSSSSYDSSSSSSSFGD